jgi:hypothetical protein
MDNMAKDYYARLGIDPAADFDQVKRAYYRMAKLCHPDRFGGDRAKEEEFKEIRRQLGAEIESLMMRLQEGECGVKKEVEKMKKKISLVPVPFPANYALFLLILLVFLLFLLNNQRRSLLVDHHMYYRIFGHILYIHIIYLFLHFLIFVD